MGCKGVGGPPEPDSVSFSLRGFDPSQSGAPWSWPFCGWKEGLTGLVEEHSSGVGAWGGSEGVIIGWFACLCLVRPADILKYQLQPGWPHGSWCMVFCWQTFQLTKNIAVREVVFFCGEATTDRLQKSTKVVSPFFLRWARKLTNCQGPQPTSQLELLSPPPSKKLSQILYYCPKPQHLIMDVSETSWPRTQAKNATTHPGDIVLQAQGKQHSKAEKVADDKLLRDAQVEEEQARKEGIACLPDMEMEMEVRQAVVKNLAPVHPHPRVKPKKAIPMSMEVTSAKDGTMETEVICYSILQSMGHWLGHDKVWKTHLFCWSFTCWWW